MPRHEEDATLRGEIRSVLSSGVRAQRVILGDSGVQISRLGFGLGSSGCGAESMQARQAPAEVAAWLRDGVGRGVTWWDTSDNYGSHPHVAEALRAVPRAAVQIATKSFAATATELRESVARSRRELGVDVIDLLLLHEIDSLQDLEARAGAIEALRHLRDEGTIGAGGLSTHAIDVLEAAAGDPRVSIVLTNYNFAGVHMDADVRDYERALQRAFAAGQGVCVMKTLGEGVLADRLETALRHNLAQPFIHGVLVGVTSAAQVERAAGVWAATRADG